MSSRSWPEGVDGEGKKKERKNVWRRIRVGGKKCWREERRESRKMERMEKEREQSEEKEEEYSKFSESAQVNNACFVR